MGTNGLRKYSFHNFILLFSRNLDQETRLLARSLRFQNKLVRTHFRGSPGKLKIKPLWIVQSASVEWRYLGNDFRKEPTGHRDIHVVILLQLSIQVRHRLWLYHRNLSTPPPSFPASLPNLKQVSLEETTLRKACRRRVVGISFWVDRLSVEFSGGTRSCHSLVWEN